MAADSFFLLNAAIWLRRVLPQASWGSYPSKPASVLTTVLGTVVHWAGANSPYYEENDKTDLEAVMGPG